MGAHSELCHSLHTSKCRALRELLSWLGSGSFLPLRLILHASPGFSTGIHERQGGEDEFVDVAWEEIPSGFEMRVTRVLLTAKAGIKPHTMRFQPKSS